MKQSTSDAPAQIGVLLCGHGSRNEETRAEFERFVTSTQAALAARRLSAQIGGAFLEFSSPSIDDGLNRFAGSGAVRIVVQPLMLFAAKHARADIPNMVKIFAKAHTGIRVVYGEELSPNTALLTAAADRVRSVDMETDQSARSDTLLLVIGRGSSDPEANKILATFTRDLSRRLPITRSAFAFAGIAEPDIEKGLLRAIGHKPRRIVVFPYFLFTGILVKRIHRMTKEAARLHPGIEFIVAPHLADHDAVVATVAKRIVEMAHGTP